MQSPTFDKEMFNRINKCMLMKCFMAGTVACTEQGEFSWHMQSPAQDDDVSLHASLHGSSHVPQHAKKKRIASQHARSLAKGSQLPHSVHAHSPKSIVWRMLTAFKLNASTRAVCFSTTLFPTLLTSIPSVLLPTLSSGCSLRNHI